jgi:pyruvate dehydrogenase complex dehydrogenase (E1) component
VTTSPDVTVSTNLGPWVNRRGIFDRAERADAFREEKVVSAQRWAMSPQGQHIELGIAESNLFLQLAAPGLAEPLFLASFEPAYADELAILLRCAFEEIQREAGESVYFRLSTRPIEQPRRTIEPDLAEAIVAGAYWLSEPGRGAELASPIAAPSHPKRSPRIRRWPKMSRNPGFWRSPRPIACTASGGRHALAAKSA